MKTQLNTNPRKSNIELLRIYLLERLYSGPIEKLSGWITAKAESLLAKVEKD